MLADARAAIEAALEPVAEVTTERVDLGPDDAVDPAAIEVPHGALVTAFGVLGRAPSFAAFVEALLEAAADDAATVVLDAPNDALGPVGSGTWTEGTTAELRSLLPEGHVCKPIVELRGAAVGEAVTTTGPGPSVAGEPAGWLLAFGPRCLALGDAAVVAAQDTLELRREERARQSELEALRAMGERLRAAEREVEELRAALRDAERATATTQP